MTEIYTTEQQLVARFSEGNSVNGSTHEVLEVPQSLKKFSLPPSHPVCITRDIASILYDRLDSFVEENISRPNSGFGFSAKNIAPVRLEEFANEITHMIKALTKVIKIAALDPMVVAAQDHAKDLKVNLQIFLSLISNETFSQGVPEAALPDLVQRAIVFQRGMSDHMNDLASLSYGVQISRGSRQMHQDDC